jgi:predicted HTH transcriptional regulator
MDIKIAIYDDRLEIENPGTFPFGLTVDDLKAGVSRIRNPVIARVLHELDFMEHWGSGYLRISDDCHAGGYNVPKWAELSQVVRTVFEPHAEVVAAGVVGARSDPANDPANDPAIAQLNERQKWFLSQVAAGKPVRALHIAERFGVARPTAKRDVRALVDKKLIEFVGPTKTGRYVRS